MIVPNKFTPLDKSILGKLNHLILDGIDEISLEKLLELKLSCFADVGELMLALDTLFILGRLDVSKEGVVKYAS